MKNITRGMMDRLLKNQGHVCPLCRGWLLIDPSKPWHVDHKIPVSKGGRHREDNLQVTHGECNLRKSDKLQVSA